MGKISIPKGSGIYSINIERFLGANLTDAPSYVSPYRSPSCQNMIRESAGKVRKWIGWHTVKHYNGRINGFHSYKIGGEKINLIHAGNTLYMNDKAVYTDMGDERSVSKQLNGKLYVADGKKLLVFYKENNDYICKAVEENAFVPTVVISRKANGGGTTYQQVNMLSDKRKDSFLCSETDTVFQLSANNLLSIDKVEKLNSKGKYDEVTNYTKDLKTGKITFESPPGKSVIEGQDNLIVTYSKSVSKYHDIINKSNIMTLYGVNGSMDRLFLAGNKEYPNRDYFCQIDDGSYWGDLSYCVIAQDKSKIMGYSVINDKLATHIDYSENNTNTVLRIGKILQDGTPAFTLSGSFQGSGAVSQYAFSNLGTEPLFLTKEGIMAVTPSDVLGERYAQLRSYYLNGLLLKQNLSEAVSCTYDGFYMLSVGGYLFALDGTQSSNEMNEPYSNRQYEGFYRTNVDARCIADIDGSLTFGTNSGDIRQFYKDYSLQKNFNDDGKAIVAQWTTPEIVGKNFYYKKRFKTISAMIGSAVATGMRIWAVYDGVKEEQVPYDSSARYLCFSKLTFSKISFKTDKTAYVYKEKISIKPDSKKCQFIFENNIINEPFAIYNAAIEFTESR